MKIFRNFYFWYLLVFLINSVLAFQIEDQESELANAIGALWMLMAMGFMPIGVSQVIMSFAFYYESKQNYWQLYFFALTIWILLFLYNRQIDVNNDFIWWVVFGLACFCYLLHLILYYFHTKNT